MNATVPFVFILPVAYVLLIRFGPPMIRARVRKTAEQSQGVSEPLEYFSSPSPAEERARLAEEQWHAQQSDVIANAEVFTTPLSLSSDDKQDEPLSEGEMPEQNVPFWIDHDGMNG